MKKLIVLMSLGLAMFTITSCHKKVLKGNGNNASETRILQSFDEVEANGSTNIQIVKDTETKVIVRGSSNLIPLYQTKVKGDRLVLQFEERFWNVRNDDITIEVHAPEVNDIRLNGSGNVNMEAGFDQDRLDVSVSGSGDVKVLNSKFYVMDLKINGSGDINTRTSDVEKIYAKISGSGNMDVSVNQYLEVDINGSGTIFYGGNPSEIKQNISGSGEIRKR